jgi:DNA-directed RNA polymerase specialized sigma24 family protein
VKLTKEKLFLQQIQKLDKLIENKMVEVRQLKELATSTAGDLTGDKVQSTPNPHRIAETIAKYVDLEKEINEDIDRLIDARRDIISVIEQLNAVEYDVLHKLYVQNFTFQDVATAYDMSYSWATTVHGRALKHVRKILDEREENK